MNDRFRSSLRIVAVGATLLLTAPSALAGPPGVAQGYVLLNSGESPEHSTPSGWPRRWLDVGVPLRVRFTGMGKCAFEIRVHSERNNTLMHKDLTEPLQLPADYTSRFVVADAHNRVKVYLTPVARPDAPCAGVSSVTEARTQDFGHRHMVLHAVKTDPIYVPYAPDTAGSLRLDVAGYGEARCSLSVRVSGAGIARTFVTPEATFPGVVTVPGMAKELRGLPTGSYNLTVSSASSPPSHKCVGEVTGPLELEAAMPALVAVKPSQSTYFSFKPEIKQAFTITTDRPSAQCDLRVRVISRDVESTSPLSVIQELKLPNATLPLTISEGQFGFQRISSGKDSLSHIEVIPDKGCRPSQAVTGDFEVQGQPNGGPVGLAVPTIQGLQPIYSTSQSIYFSVGFPDLPASPYAANGFGCCEVQTFVLDNSGGWVKQSSVDKPADSMGNIAFTSGYFTSAQFPKHPWLIRIRGYRQGNAPAWSGPARFEFK